MYIYINTEGKGTKRKMNLNRNAFCVNMVIITYMSLKLKHFTTLEKININTVNHLGNDCIKKSSKALICMNNEFRIGPKACYLFFFLLYNSINRIVKLKKKKKSIK